MVFNTGAALLDAIVLASVSKEPEGAYGYKITQDVRDVLEISESTLYPVLRRLQKDQFLETYDQAFNGRNRRYYRITGEGKAKLTDYTVAWKDYTTKINNLFMEGEQYE
ncbi:MAG: PadR family transcriptional regulator [Lachnospiraceae bacterium]|jgi:PadR family transcriptional regulator PadR|nr:PadR family transcriptional regulator [Lachnospiraceae bacterium]